MYSTNDKSRYSLYRKMMMKFGVDSNIQVLEEFGIYPFIVTKDKKILNYKILKLFRNFMSSIKS